MRDAILPKPQFRSKDVSWTQSEKACILAEKLNLNNVFEHVYTVADGLIFIADLDRADSSLTWVKPQVVVLDIGSNDIAGVDTFDPCCMLELANSTFEFADSIRSQVVANAVLPRVSNMTASAEVFRQNSTQYNECLSNLCTTSDHVAFNKLRGFAWLFQAPGHKLPREVGTWSDDGIHCNSANMEHYANRVRHAMLKAANKCRD